MVHWHLRLNFQPRTWAKWTKNKFDKCLNRIWSLFLSLQKNPNSSIKFNGLDYCLIAPKRLFFMVTNKAMGGRLALDYSEKTQQQTFMQKRIQELIETLRLQPHPEGGYYAEIYRAPQSIDTANGKRHLLTSIYFLLTSKNISRFHQIKSDEIWFYHEGSPLTVHVLSENGYEKLLVGPATGIGHLPQQMVPAGVIFGSTVDEPESYSLVSCVVAPGFDFQDFKLFDEVELLELFPAEKAMIRRMF